ncbi:glycosyltransferase family 2 protein [Candidatus Woesearchaeota archaeon]|nr:glycosyltransferase family 2 protein [Candidatus Woesearchaeota archaeon]RLE42232.1 MAG: glycosyltransferase family 2 protein [Candidatus Woesearchaeota archaeon]
MKNIFVVIPAFNEERKIERVLQGLKEHGYSNIIVVDDGSSDNTSKIAKKAGAVVLRHVINRGQGAALKTGIDYALEEGADIIVTFDADGQHNPADLAALIKPVKSGEADIALGSRFIKSDSNTPFVRKLFLKGGAILFRVLYGIKLTDSHNGLRAMNRKAASSIEITCDDMAHASEIVEEVAKHKLRYKEVPVTITYTDYSLSKGQSTLNSIRILSRMLLNKLLK